MNKQLGLTLLEAVFALALMAIGAMALFDWMGSNALTLARVEGRVGALSAERSALAVIESINPMIEPEGRREIAGLEVWWTSTLLDGPRTGRGSGGPATVFDLALYELEVGYQTPSMGSPGAFKVRRAGWVTARSFESAE